MKLRYLIGLCSLLTLAAVAADLTLTWDANPPDEGVTAYVVYRAPARSTNFTVVAATSTNHLTFTNLPPAGYQFRVTARNVWGESLPSQIVGVPTLPGAPTNVKVQLTWTLSGP